MVRLADQEWPYDQLINAALSKGIKRILRCIDDGFASQVVAGIEQDRDASRFTEFLDNPIVGWVPFPTNGLHAASTADVADCPHLIALILSKGRNH